jgi:hypothetical protein
MRIYSFRPQGGPLSKRLYKLWMAANAVLALFWLLSVFVYAFPSYRVPNSLCFCCRRTVAGIARQSPMGAMGKKRPAAMRGPPCL